MSILPVTPHNLIHNLHLELTNKVRRQKNDREAFVFKPYFFLRSAESTDATALRGHARIYYTPAGATAFRLFDYIVKKAYTSAEEWYEARGHELLGLAAGAELPPLRSELCYGRGEDALTGEEIVKVVETHRCGCLCDTCEASRSQQERLGLLRTALDQMRAAEKEKDCPPAQGGAGAGAGAVAEPLLDEEDEDEDECIPAPPRPVLKEEDDEEEEDEWIPPPLPVPKKKICYERGIHESQSKWVCRKFLETTKALDKEGIVEREVNLTLEGVEKEILRMTRLKEMLVKERRQMKEVVTVCAKEGWLERLEDKEIKALAKKLAETVMARE
jgi:hypothetical protein